VHVYYLNVLGLIFDVEVFDKPRTLVRGTLRASKSPNKPHTLVCGKTQGLFDINKVLSKIVD
jgi:hypothetical protein